jgi:murein L,D-transpeptidase YcbB/YkuD
MAALPAIVGIASLIGTGLTVASALTVGAGSAVQAQGTLAAGKAAEEIGLAQQKQSQAQGDAARAQAEYEARNLDAQAKQEFAASQREALQYRRQKQLALSSLQAKGAASGFDPNSASNLAIADEIEKYGTVQEGMAMYGGSARARNLEATAAGKRLSGQSAYDAAYSSGDIYAKEGYARKEASQYGAAGTILGGVSTMASRFGSMASPTPTSRYDQPSSYTGLVYGPGY